MRHFAILGLAGRFSATLRNNDGYSVNIILGCDSRHLWFLWTLFIYFVISGVLDKIIRRNWNNKLFAMLTAFLIALSWFSDNLTSWLSISSITKYYCYFFVGMYVDFNKEKLPDAKTNGVAFIVASIIFVFCVYMGGKPFYSIIGAFCGIIAFCFALKRLNNIINRSKMFTIIKANAMGIYIIHPMIIYIWFYFLGNELNPYLSCVLAVLLSGIISTAFSMLLHKAKLDVLLGG